MKLDWPAIRTRYEQQPTVQPLKGSSTLRIVDIDDEKVCFQQRLWRDCITRANLETAVALLADRAQPPNAIEFADELRSHYASGPNAITDCTRIPNLSAVVLKDLGYLT